MTMKNKQDSKPPAIPPLPPATGSAIICPHCGKPDGAYLYDLPVYDRWSNADSQRMHHKYGCKSCDKIWTERISPNNATRTSR